MSGQQYDNNNRFSLWGNDRKKEERDPDFRGTIMIDGVEYWINGWKRKKGANPKSPALSGSVRRKEQRQERQEAPPAKQDEFVDSDIPF